MKKITAFTLTALFSAAIVFSFDWPQKEIKSDSFHTYFGQKRGGQISPSLVFTESDIIKTSGEGYVTAVLSEHDEESGLFESTLGNAVITVHKDSLMTVYANLSSEEQEERYKLTKVTDGQPLGTCGISGWQEGNALLEFQVIDLKAKTLVNPRVLMPRFGNELPLTITNVTAVKKNGTIFDLNTQKHLASGTYLIYRDRQPKAMPYKSTVLINGAEADSLTWDTLIQKDGKICTQGRKNYPYSLIYPDKSRQLVAEVNIPKGRNKISLVLKDILGKEKTLTYTIDAF